MEIDWLGVIGAAAWSVPVIGWIKKSLTRPEVQIFTAPAPEIGFSMYGPILNIRIALAARHRDIVVTKMSVQLTHEGGSIHRFDWRGMMQTMGQMRSPQGQIPFERESEVLALKVTQNAVEERFIRFQDPDYWAGRALLDEAARRKLMYNRKNGVDDAEFYASQEMSQVYQFTKQYFYWRPGRYRLEFLLESPEKFIVQNTSFYFILSDNHVAELEKNRDKTEDAWKWQISNPEDKSGMPLVWIYPDLRKDY